MSATSTIMPATRTEPASTAADRLGSLFDQHHRRLFSLAARLTGGSADAQDLVQETFLRAAARPGSLPAGPEGEKAWLVRVLVNLCRDRDRRLRVRLREHRRMAVAEVAGPGHESASLARQAVRKALLGLDARRRAIVVLHELEELSTREIAELMKLSQVTVRWHLSRARKQLGRELGVIGGSTGSGRAMKDRERTS